MSHLITYSSLLAFIGHYKHYNNHSGAYIAGTRNSTGAYIVIMASLQALVNSRLVWQSSCENKLRPLKQRFSRCLQAEHR